MFQAPALRLATRWVWLAWGLWDWCLHRLLAVMQIVSLRCQMPAPACRPFFRWRGPVHDRKFSCRTLAHCGLPDAYEWPLTCAVGPSSSAGWLSGFRSNSVSSIFLVLPVARPILRLGWRQSLVGSILSAKSRVNTRCPHSQAGLSVSWRGARDAGSDGTNSQFQARELQVQPARHYAPYADSRRSISTPSVWLFPRAKL